LLESGANVNAASKHGWTPLMATAWEGDAIVVAGAVEARRQRDTGE
jgi:ankyrin repeat protein